MRGRIRSTRQVTNKRYAHAMLPPNMVIAADWRRFTHCGILRRRQRESRSHAPPEALPPPPPKQRIRIQVIERMMKLLDVLSYYHRPGQPQAAGAGDRPASVHRPPHSGRHGRHRLRRTRPSRGTYRLGIRLLELGNVVKSRINIREAAMPLMQTLHQRIGESVNLGVRQGDEIVYVERTSSGRSSVRVVHLVGARAPLHVTAVGKLYLAEDDREQLRDYARRTGLPGLTPHFAHHAAGAGEGARPGTPPRRGLRQRGNRTGTALHRRAGARRRGRPGRRPFGIGPGRALRPGMDSACCCATADAISATIGYVKPPAR